MDITTVHQYSVLCLPTLLCSSRGYSEMKRKKELKKRSSRVKGNEEKG
jgi:hypothetical protein